MDVAAEESADDVSAVRTAAALDALRAERTRDAIWRKNSSTASGGTSDRRPGALLITYGSPCGTTSTSPASSRTGRLPSKRRPAPALSNDVVRDDVLGAGQHDRRERPRRRGTSSTQGDEVFIGKNKRSGAACTVRRTSDSTSTLPDRARTPRCALGRPGRQRGRSVMAFGHGAILHSPVSLEDCMATANRPFDDVGVRRLPPLCYRNRLGAGPAYWSRHVESHRASGCSTSRPAAATWRSAPRWPARGSSHPT